MKTVTAGKVSGKVSFIFYMAVMLVCSVLPLSVFGADKLLVKDTGGNTKFVATDTGMVGIGIATPLAMLHVLPINNATDAMYGEMVADAGWATFKLLHARGTTSNKTSVLDGDILGRFVMWGHDGTAYNRSGSFEVAVDGAPTLGSTPGRVSFSTVPAGSGSLVERMRITSAGNVGMGTTAPAQKLEINGGVRLNTATAQPACTSAARGTFWITQGTTDDVVQVCAMTGGVLKWTTVQRL
jgi:hypothetical protein